MTWYEICHRSRRCLEGRDDLVLAPDEAWRREARLLDGHAERGRDAVEDLLRVVGHVHEADERLQLEILEPVAGRVPDPLDLLVGGFGRHRLGDFGRRVGTRPQVGVDPDDLGLARREPEDLRRATTDEERHRLLQRLRHTVELGDAVVLAVERERARCEQALHDRDRLAQAGDAHAGTVERDACLLVVGGHPSRADTELQSTVGEQVERRHLPRADHRVLVVVAQDERADAQSVGDRGRVRERDRGCEIVLHEVVRHEQRRVSERLGLTRELGELPARPPFAAGNRETKSPVVHRPTLAPAGRSPTAGAASGIVERVDLAPVDVVHALDDELRDPITAPDLECRARIEVDEEHADLVTESGVDQAG